MRKGGDNRNYCFLNISDAAAIQFDRVAFRVRHEPYGFVADAIEQVAAELHGKNSEINREIPGPDEKLTTLFVKACNALMTEIRLPR